MDNLKTVLDEYKELLKIVSKLRDPDGGCPWDREQTLLSLKKSLLEEAYEVVDAAAEESIPHLVEELGDLLSVITLYCQIGVDEKKFTFEDVLKGINKKLITRHPHVFGDAQTAQTSEEAVKNWQAAKAKEKGNSSVIGSIPRSMPALQRAQKVGERCAQVKFEWPTVRGVQDKVLEEIKEFITEVKENPADVERQKEEFGDILFALSQLSRRLGYNSEDVLTSATDKFSKRFQAIEKLAYERNGAEGLQGMSLEAMDELWNEVKLIETKMAVQLEPKARLG